MNAVLTKPVLTQQLEESLAMLLTHNPVDDIIGGNPALLARVRDAFARQNPELLARIARRPQPRRLRILARNAHKLKGSLSHFGGPAMAIVRELESAAKAGQLTTAAGRSRISRSKLRRSQVDWNLGGEVSACRLFMVVTRRAYQLSSDCSPDHCYLCVIPNGWL